jgi:branched-subunit amino acid ABC-type transport system permease component
VDFLLIVVLQVAYAIALLLLTSIGLAVAFGMMRVINFAHGEFLMLGGFVMIFAVRWGVNFWVAMFVVTPVALALFGAVVERIIIRPLYGRILDTILATWGLSLLLIGVTAVFLGYNQTGIAAPFGSFAIGGERVSFYSLFVIGVAATVTLVLYLLLQHTRFGLLCRGTMQQPEMAAAIGISLPRIYATTFALSAALSGLAGAVIAPLTGVVPTTGMAYVSQAFIAVITGGANALVGTLSAAILFGTASQLVTIFSTSVLGQTVMLLTAIVLLRLMPAGITGRFFRSSV